jgi:hypothetical protein
MMSMENRFVGVSFSFSLLLLIALAGLTYRSSAEGGLASLANRVPFQVKIDDQQTGNGVPNVAVIADDHIICHTGSDGSVTRSESSLMNREIKFRIKNANYRLPDNEATLHVNHGGYAELKILR